MYVRINLILMNEKNSIGRKKGIYQMIEELIRKIAREEAANISVIEPGTELFCRGNLKTMQALLKRGRSFSLEVFWLFREELDANSNGFVYYPDDPRAGKSYNFDAQKMADWIRENESRIFKK